ncbi:MAG: response regulator [Fibromonadaceae bacterium]|jgi:putative two-component system response regulator|nr:response regulator [Fibromonadaceae bacterium]
MKIIFVVDDSAVNLTKAKQALEGRYRVLTLLSAEKMFTLIEKITPDLILLDVEMPEMDGFTALQKLKEDSRTKHIPVIFLTAFSDESRETRGFELKAVDFIAKPFSTPVLLNRISHHLHIEGLVNEQTKMLKHKTQQLEQLNTSIISIIAELVENRDKLTGGHIERSTKYLRLLINAMLERGVYAEELQDWDKEAAIASARLHDVGKIKISDLILNKPGKLTADEFELMKSHAAEGEQIIDHMITQTNGGLFLHYAKFFAGYHHEHWDGNGYPRKLKGTEIPLQGRLMAIVDVYDALVSARVYKPAFLHQEAVRIIMSEKNKHFDPKIADVFFEVHTQFEATSKGL